MRRNPKVAVASCAALALALLSRLAHAGNMDITPERLASCAGTVCTSAELGAANVAWANLMSELGAATAPTAFHAARTTGLGGFALSFESSFTHINADATAGGKPYWHAGTEGQIDPSTHEFSSTNTSPDSILGVYSLKARKGFGYGIEITGVLGLVGQTSLWLGGADLRWALLEGYRTGPLGYLPDVSIGAGVRTVSGSSKFYLTTVGLDAQISKPFTLGDSAVLTPYLGFQRVIIFADSSVVDLTPSVDPLQQCGYRGPNVVPGNPNAAGHLAGNQAPNDGTPVCVGGNGSNADFNNDTTFRRARVHRWRGLAGVNYKFEVLYLAAQFAFDLTDPSAENDVIGVVGARQWTTSLEAGVSF